MSRPSWFQTALMVVVAVLTTLLLVRPSPYPSVIQAADVSGQSTSGRSGNIIALVGNSTSDHRLYLIDTEKKRICVYRNIGDRFRVVAMRTYRYDMEFDDSSLFSDIETGRGATASRIKALINRMKQPQGQN